ncbi:MAG: integral rane sensor signal transduction histidine kinase [Phycisphaerales bacterium]|jgi:two-component system sensor histidine kinase RegB|nr:integral rane sensor signal transduction histidine kinase [Phycisphaerales bacterium]
MQEPQIVLAALTRLRWLAVVGQITATAVAVGVLHLRLPLTPIFGIILLTALSNGLLHLGVWLPKTPAWLVEAVLLLDIILLTSLLYLTGGPENPFATLYLVHVAMSVMVLGTASTWLMVAMVAACYGALLRWHLPLAAHQSLPPWVSATGSWLALVLVSVLIAAFIGRVIRSLRQREMELAGVREHAVKNEQLAALTTLAAGAAHELNTPLGTIALVARELELACDQGDAADSMLDDARLIRREVDRCRHILNRMRVDVGEDVSFRSVVRLSDLIERLRENFDGPDRERLNVVRGPDVETAVAPSRALEQSLLVLLRNAFDASPRQEPVMLEVSRAGGRVRFEVSDKGAGMSPEMLRRAGEPFFTTKEPGKGMGLGLFLVHMVAEQCGARFSIASRPGEGTRCTFELPESRGRNGDGRGS